METPKDRNGEAEDEKQAPPKKDEPSYEDSWYQVMKRRAEEAGEGAEDEEREDS